MLEIWEMRQFKGRFFLPFLDKKCSFANVQLCKKQIIFNRWVLLYVRIRSFGNVIFLKYCARWLLLVWWRVTIHQWNLDLVFYVMNFQLLCRPNPFALLPLPSKFYWKRVWSFSWLPFWLCYSLILLRLSDFWYINCKLDFSIKLWRMTFCRIWSQKCSAYRLPDVVLWISLEVSYLSKEKVLKAFFRNKNSGVIRHRVWRKRPSILVDW